MSALLFEPLFNWSQEGPRPLLAEAWAASEDSTEWTIVLKRDVRFHNGVILTPEDVVCSIERAMESQGSCKWLLRRLLAVAPAAGSQRGAQPASPGERGGPLQAEGDRAAGTDGGAAFQDSETAPGRRAVLFTFSEPEPDLPRLLSCPGLSVLAFSRSRYEPDSGPIVGVPSGTGPFRLARAMRPTEFELVANEDHHLGRPFLDSVKLAFAPFDEGLLQFQAGSAVLLAGIPSPLAGGLASLPAGTRRIVSESSYLTYLGCNPAHDGLRSIINRRMALTAVDRSSILASIVGTGGRIAQSLLGRADARHQPWDAASFATRPSGAHPGEETPSTESPEPDVGPDSSARALTLLVPRWHSLIEEIGDRIQVDLMEAGFAVRLRKVGREELRSKLAAGDFDLFVGLWAPDRSLTGSEWLAHDFWETQIAPVPALASAVPPQDRLGPADLENALAEDALLLPLFYMDLVVYLRDSLVPAEADGGLPDLGWSWLRAGGR